MCIFRLAGRPLAGDGPIGREKPGRSMAQGRLHVSLVPPVKEAMMVDGTKKSRHLSGCLDLIDHTSLGSVCCPLCLVCLCKYTPCLSELPGVEDIPPRPSSLPACPQPPMAFHACVCGPTKGNSTCYLFCCSPASISLVSPSSLPFSAPLVPPSTSEPLANVPCPTTASHIIGPPLAKLV